MLKEALSESETYRIRLEQELKDVQNAIARIAKTLVQDPPALTPEEAAGSLEDQLKAFNVQRNLLHDVRQR